MRERLLAVLLFGATILTASSAWGAAIWSVSASSSDGSPLVAVTPGSQIVLDISLRTTDRAFSIAGSVSGYDNRFIRLNTYESMISETVLSQVCIPGGFCFGGLSNYYGGSGSYTFEERAVGPGVEAEFLAAYATAAAGGDGSIDPGVATGVPGDAQFRIVFDVIGVLHGTTTLQIGTFAEYLDGYSGTEDQLSENASVTITVVPEPSTALLVGLGLGGLAAARRSERGCYAARTRLAASRPLTAP